MKAIRLLKFAIYCAPILAGACSPVYRDRVTHGPVSQIGPAYTAEDVCPKGTSKDECTKNHQAHIRRIRRLSEQAYQQMEALAPQKRRPLLPEKPETEAERLDSERRVAAIDARQKARLEKSAGTEGAFVSNPKSK